MGRLRTVCLPDMVHVHCWRDSWSREGVGVCFAVPGNYLNLFSASNAASKAINRSGAVVPVDRQGRRENWSNSPYEKPILSVRCKRGVEICHSRNVKIGVSGETCLPLFASLAPTSRPSITTVEYLGRSIKPETEGRQLRNLRSRALGPRPR